MRQGPGPNLFNAQYDIFNRYLLANLNGLRVNGRGLAPGGTRMRSQFGAEVKRGYWMRGTRLFTLIVGDNTGFIPNPSIASANTAVEDYLHTYFGNYWDKFVLQTFRTPDSVTWTPYGAYPPPTSNSIAYGWNEYVCSFVSNYVYAEGDGWYGGACEVVAEYAKYIIVRAQWNIPNFGNGTPWTNQNGPTVMRRWRYLPPGTFANHTGSFPNLQGTRNLPLFIPMPLTPNIDTTGMVHMIFWDITWEQFKAAYPTLDYAN